MQYEFPLSSLCSQTQIQNPQILLNLRIRKQRDIQDQALGDNDFDNLTSHRYRELVHILF